MGHRLLCWCGGQRSGLGRYGGQQILRCAQDDNFYKVTILIEGWLGLQEGEKVGVDGVGFGGAHAVGEAGVDF